MKTAIFSLGLLLLSTQGSQANDTIATYSPQGIQIEKSNTIRMKEEYLTITPHKIGVSYKFFNESDQDITTEVAFPLPEIDADFFPDETFLNTNIFPDQTFDDFIVIVNGDKIPYQTTITPMKNGQDISAQIKALNLPTNRPHDPKDISNALKQKAKTQDLYRYDEITDTLRPNYSLSRTYHWTQTFPARKDVIIRHAYTPALGGNSSYTLTLQEKWAQLCPTTEHAKKPSCLFANGDDMQYGTYGAAYLNYILKTGSNWKNGIENFHLSLSGSDLIFAEIDGQKDVGFTSLEIEKKNFHPTQNLSIEFVDPLPKTIPTPFQIFKQTQTETPCLDKEFDHPRFIIPAKTIVKLKEKTTNNTYKIEYKNETCWINRKYLSPLTTPPPEEHPAPSPPKP